MIAIDNYEEQPAYKYYIETLLYNNLCSDLDNDFYGKYKYYNKGKEYYLAVDPDILEEFLERLDYYLSTQNYEDLYYVKSGTLLYFYLVVI